MKKSIEKILLLALPCAALIISYFILAPRLPALREYMEENKTKTELSEPEAVTESPSPAPTAEPEPLGTRLYISTLSTEHDLIVLVRDEAGRAVEGERFEIILSSEDAGQQSYYTTETGRCYIVELPGGEYTVSLGEQDGYYAGSVAAKVEEEARYQAIADVSELLGILDMSQMSLDEIKGNLPISTHDIIAQELSGSSNWVHENGHTYYKNPDGSYAVGLKKIGGRLCYFNQFGQMASSLGVDVSCFNGAVNWQLVKEQGVDFAIVRIGGRGWESGLVYTDSMALDHILGAKNAGLKVGAYFYSAAINAAEAIQEASVVLEKLGGMGLEMPVYIDMELSSRFPSGRADALSKAQRLEIVSAFCKTIENSGYDAGIYSGESLLSNSLDHRALSRYSVWLANYTENNTLPTYPHDYHIWQFTDRGRVAGMSGNVDINVIF